MSDVWVWRKSSFSDIQGDECVEVACREGQVLVRDSKDAGGGRLAFGAPAWRAFVATAPVSHGGE